MEDAVNPDRGQVMSFTKSCTRAHPTQRRAVETRARIIAAGREIYDEVGRDYLTTSDVAKRAEVAIGTFYRYFSDRGVLIAMLLADDPVHHAQLRILKAAAALARTPEDPALNAALATAVTSLVEVTANSRALTTWRSR